MVSCLLNAFIYFSSNCFNIYFLNATVTAIGFKRNRQVFSHKMQVEFPRYSNDGATMWYCLSNREICKLASGCAIKFQFFLAHNWHTKCMIFPLMGSVHLWNVILHSQHKLFNRATSFNRYNVNAYFDLLEEVMDSLHIWLFFHCKCFAAIAVNTNRNKIPQIFLFRAKKYRKYFAGIRTPGCTCLAN